MKRRFTIGEEWLYYKIYCGNRTSDAILTETIQSLTESLIDKKLIDKWFFIRYSDPEDHIRIRFHCINVSKIGEILLLFKEAIQYYITSDLIWNVQIDMYQRELERYGKQNIIDTESIFFYDSVTCLRALNFINEDELLFLYALRSIDDFLSVFGYNLIEKMAFSKRNKDIFRKEFHADKKLNKELNIKYRLLKLKIEQFMSIEQHNIYDHLLDLLAQKRKRIDPIAKRLLSKKIVNDRLLSNYIHMMVNRFFRDKQRLHELVCYEFLHNYYNTIFARQKIEIY